MKDLIKKHDILNAIKNERHTNPCGSGKFSCARCAIHIDGKCLAIKAKKDSKYKVNLMAEVAAETKPVTFSNLERVRNFIKEINNKLSK